MKAGSELTSQHWQVGYRNSRVDTASVDVHNESNVFDPVMRQLTEEEAQQIIVSSNEQKKESESFTAIHAIETLVAGPHSEAEEKELLQTIRAAGNITKTNDEIMSIIWDETMDDQDSGMCLKVLQERFDEIY